MLFLLLFKNDQNDPAKNYFDKYYLSLVEIKDQPIKNKQEAYEKFVPMSRNGDYTTGNLLHYSYHQNYYKLIDINLLR